MNGQREAIEYHALPNAERDLLARIVSQIEDLSSEVQMLQRRKNILRDAATQLRLGRQAFVVEAQMIEAFNRR